MVFRKKKPRIWKIVKEEDELGGRVWVLSAKDFDKLFSGMDCFQYKNKIWSILQMGNESVKVYRGNGK